MFPLRRDGRRPAGGVYFDETRAATTTDEGAATAGTRTSFDFVMHYTFRTFVAALAAAGLGCEWIPPVVDPELVALERALKLEIAHVDRLQNGTAEFTFALSNHGTSVADACLGPGRSVSYESSHSSGTALTLVDHPGCMKPFTIHPGGEMTWREEFQLSSSAKGSMDVEVDLQIVNPRRCAWTGCSAMEVHSNRYSIP